MSILEFFSHQNRVRITQNRLLIRLQSESPSRIVVEAPLEEILQRFSRRFWITVILPR
ncbi:hypothetical protein B0H19DRAFT_58018 [Mycena capillaripes]|nr:hypothetical protein B0H19DRAFT_58018 [Mycena capillaripes]